MISVFTLIEQEHFVYLNLAKSRVSNAEKKTETRVSRETNDWALARDCSSLI